MQFEWYRDSVYSAKRLPAQLFSCGMQAQEAAGNDAGQVGHGAFYSVAAVYE